MSSGDDQSIHQLTATMHQFAGHLHSVLGQFDVVATLMSGLSDEVRTGFRAIDARIGALDAKVDDRVDGLEAAMRTALDRQRREMNQRFAAVGRRFDDVDVRMDKLETQMRALHSDVIHMEMKVLNATQSALQAHIRLDEIDRDQTSNPGPDPS